MGFGQGFGWRGGRGSGSRMGVVFLSGDGSCGGMGGGGGWGGGGGGVVEVSP